MRRAIRMMRGWRGAVPFGAAAILTGALASLLPVAGLLVLVGALGLWLAVVLIGFQGRQEGAWHPALMLLTGLAVLSVTWNGVPPAKVAAPDLLLLAALAVLTYCWLNGSVRVPIPGWLVGAAAGLLAAELVAELFVPEPPPDPPPVFTPPGSPLVTLAKVELALLVVPIVVGAVASSWRRANLITNLWLISATISAAIATFDAVTGAGIGGALARVDPTSGAGLGSNGRAIPEQARGGGLALHPNTFALICSMTLPIGLLRAAQLRGWGRAAAIAASGLLVTGVLVSGSRVGLFSLVVAVGLMALLIAKLRSRILAAGLAAVVVILAMSSLAPEGNRLFVVFDRLAGGGTASGANTQRIDQLKESLVIAQDHPVTGVGSQTIADAHSLPLQFWEAAGLLGVLALILYVTGVFVTGWRLARDRNLPRGIPDLAGALTVSFAVWLIAGLFQNQVADRYIYVPVGLLLGLTLAANAWRSGRGRFEREPASPPEGHPTHVPEGIGRVPVAS